MATRTLTDTARIAWAETPAGVVSADVVDGSITPAKLSQTYLTASAADVLFLTPAEGNAAYQPLDADLTALGGLSKTLGNIIVGNGSTWVSRPDTINAADYGFATAASAATNKAAFDAAVAEAAVRLGAIVELPSGIFNLDPPATIAGNAITIQGQGMFGGTTLRTSSATADFLTFTGQHSGIRDCYIDGRAVKATAGFAILLSGTFQAVVRDVRIDYMFHGIRAINGAAVEGSHIQLRYLLGSRGIQCTGTVGNGLFGARFDKVDTDNPYPLAVGTRKTWTISTAFTAGDIIRVNGAIWQCSTSGTSAGAGSGPTGVPGATGILAFSTPVVDNTAQWRFVSHDSLIWFNHENYAYSVSLDNAALLNGWKGFFMNDSAATGTSFPMWFNSHGLEVDHSYDNCVHLERGEGAYFLDGWFGSSLTQRGVIVDTNFRGDALIGPGTRIVGNWSDGVLIQAGPRPVTIDGTFNYLNSQVGAGTNHGINVAAGADDFIITGNVIGAGPTGSGTQGFGVLIGAGASDDFIVVNNDLRGNATGALSDGSTSLRKITHPNVDGVTPGKIGYVAGSGGSVTQLTSKATAVTLNKPSGRITMLTGGAGGDLAASTAVIFTLNNSCIEAADVPVVSMSSGGTANAYSASVVAVGVGSCAIRVINLTGGLLNEAPIVNFVITRGSAS